MHRVTALPVPLCRRHWTLATLVTAVQDHRRQIEAMLHALLALPDPSRLPLAVPHAAPALVIISIP